MLAIFESGGKQYLVSKGDKVQVEKLAAEEGKTINFDKVLFTSTGSDANVGKPYIAGATVQGTVLKQGRGKKIHVLKYKNKSKYRRKIGARQAFTEVEITKV
ncbi:MAG TPA: 50S ribosomal protein L21 [Candidatus Limnocylindria bacterium]|nr:50S ribosomal protein L21 [Candidatus Limnocylindria bacterium]